MNALITGGCGYIGSNLANALRSKGDKVRVLDDLSSGSKTNIKLPGIEFIQGNILDHKTLTEAMEDIDIVYHLAALKSVSESVYKPINYFEVNSFGTLQIIKSMLDKKIRSIVFASSSSVYGQVSESRIPEESEKAPISPYGNSKLMAEEMIKTISKVHSLSCISLRYFNVAGSSRFGVSDTSDFNLIPNILRSYKSKSPMKVFGNNPNTHDGTCVRDYIHIDDVIEANLLAGEKCLEKLVNVELNVGLGLGFSVKQVINAFEQKIGRPLMLKIDESRPGDPGTVIAAINRIQEFLSWSPRFNLEEILTSILLDKNRPE